MRSHSPKVGKTAVHGVLLRSLLVPVCGQKALTADEYLQLVGRFSLAEEAGVAFEALWTAELADAKTIKASIRNIAAAAARSLRFSQKETDESRISTLLLVILSLSRGPCAPEVAIAFREASPNLPLKNNTILASEILAESLRIFASNFDWHPAANVALIGYSRLLLVLLSLPGVAASDQIRSLRLCVRRASEGIQDRDVKASWHRTLDIAALNDPEKPSSPEHPDSVKGNCDFGHRVLGDVELRVLWPPRENFPNEFLEIMGANGERSGAKLDGETAPVKSADKSADKAQEDLKVDLYADPGARDAQKTYISSLAPDRRVEALLTSARSETAKKQAELILKDWLDNQSACCDVVMRKAPDGSSAWPTIVVAPVITAYICNSSPGWRDSLAASFPADVDLFTEVWTEICRSASSAIIESFTEWVLTSICAPWLRADPRQARKQNIIVAIGLSTIVARTLRADLQLVLASARLRDLVGGSKCLKSEGGADASVVAASVGRLRGFGQVPISSLVLSLIHVAELPGVGEAAEQALAIWLTLASEALSLETARATVAEIGYNQSAVVAAHMARVIQARASLHWTGQLHVSAFNIRSKLGPCSTHANGDVENSDLEFMLFAACLAERASSERAVLISTLRKSSAKTLPGLRTALARVLRKWPSKRTATLILEVLPELVEDLPDTATNQTNPIMTALQMLMRIAVAIVSVSPRAIVSNVLRVVISVVRSVQYGGGSVCLEPSPVAVFVALCAFLDAAIASSPTFDSSGNPPPASMISALMLLKSLERRANTDDPAAVRRCYATMGRRVQRVQILYDAPRGGKSL